MLRPVLLALVCLLSTCLGDSSPAQEYSEQLVLRPLPTSSLLASFNFHANTSHEAFEAQNFRHFPRSLGQILQHSHTKELHLRFSSGRWDDERWGRRPWEGYKEGGTGVELWAWIDAGTDEEANARWLTLTNALSGLYCASLNFIDATRTIKPVLTFGKQGRHQHDASRNLHLLHGTLPAETVCTENLTPFLKSLPCKGKAGISSLLDGHKLFDSSWQTMSIDVQPQCPAGPSSCVVEIEQTIDMVLDIERSKRPRHDPIPRPPPINKIQCDQNKYYSPYSDSCLPVRGPDSPAFSISQVFGRAIQGACPLAGDGQPTGEVFLEDVKDGAVTVKTAGKYSEISQNNTKIYTIPSELAEDTVLDVGTDMLIAGVDFDIEFTEQVVLSLPVSQGPEVQVSRTLTGRGQQHGGFSTIFSNPSPEGPVKLSYLEPVPWFMKPFLHTLQARVEGPQSDSKAEHLIEEIYYRPSVDRKRASHLEMVLSIPAESKLTLTYDFEKAILRYTEYPPDANRGFNAASAIISILSGPNGPPDSPTYIRTASLLLYLPTPDFSMPYNVIILSSTVIALAFGSIFNIITRRFVASDEVVDGKGLKSRVKKGVQIAIAKLTRSKKKTE